MEKSKYLFAKDFANKILLDRCNISLSDRDDNYICMDNFIQSIFINNSEDEYYSIVYPSYYGRSAFCFLYDGDDKIYSYDSGLGYDSIYDERKILIENLFQLKLIE